VNDPLQAHLDAGWFDPSARELVARLARLDQRHLFAGWAPPGRDDAEKQVMVAQLVRADGAYPGGLATYIERARALLARARAGANPFEGFTPSRPEAEDLSTLDARYRAMERLGVEAAGGLGIVLVAGGLGERLGYDGIKVDIPVEVTTNVAYLDLYARLIRALGRRAGRPIPLVIMTSGQTHARTLTSLERGGWFGLDRDQVTVLQQELVPALADERARVALDGAYRVSLKPHGHGDIHLLLHRSGTARRLAERGTTHLAFIQDTNAQVVNSLMALLGSSVRRDLAFNTLAVPRMSGEAVGAITRLTSAEQELTINVEYNQLDDLLRATVDPRGDVGDERGVSPFPGNTNTLLVRMREYLPALESSGGVIAEFVNPKYADAERTRFKKPTRLETMMQDLPRLFTSGQRVGVTVMDRRWCFSADKNNLTDARAKADAGRPPECAASAEADWFEGGRRKLAAAGAAISPARTVRYHGIPVADGPRPALAPSFGLTLDDVDERVHGLSLGRDASLVLEGREIWLRDVRIADGAGLVVRAAPGARVRVRGRSVTAPGPRRIPLSDAEMRDPAVPAALRIRGYRGEPGDPHRIEIDRPGDYEVGPDGVIRQIYSTSTSADHALPSEQVISTADAVADASATTSKVHLGPSGSKLL